MTPVMIAAINEHRHIIDYLLHIREVRASINLRDAGGSTVLHWAVLSLAADHFLMRSLVEAGADPTIANFRGETPKDIAIRHHDHEFIKVLQVRMMQWMSPPY